MSSPEENDQDFGDFGELADEAFASEGLEAADALPSDFEALPDEPAGLPADQQPEVRQQPAEVPVVLQKEASLSLLEEAKRADVFTLMLVLSLVALLIAVFCLLGEWASYGFDTSAKSAAVQLVAPIRSRGLVGLS